MGAAKKSPEMNEGKMKPTVISFPRIWVPQSVVALVIAIGLLSGAGAEYFAYARWVLCSSLAYMAYQAYLRFKSPLERLHDPAITMITLAGVGAIAFNPIFPIYMEKNVWVQIDLIAVIACCVSLYNQFKSEIRARLGR